MTQLTRHDFLNCDLSQWDGDPSRCRWCDLPLNGRPEFCCADCKTQAIENHAWNKAKALARARDKVCVECGARRRLGVHHVRPCNGVRSFSCSHHLGNLELLCDLCHAAAHEAAA